MVLHETTLSYAVSNITSFSTLPLWIITCFGIFSVILGSIFGGISLYQKMTGVASAGFTTVNILLLLIGGMIMLSLGIMGHYVGRIYQELKGRPIYVLQPTSVPRGSPAPGNESPDEPGTGLEPSEWP